jgi:hypothetical protein
MMHLDSGLDSLLDFLSSRSAVRATGCQGARSVRKGDNGAIPTDETGVEGLIWIRFDRIENPSKQPSALGGPKIIFGPQEDAYHQEELCSLAKKNILGNEK